MKKMEAFFVLTLATAFFFAGCEGTSGNYGIKRIPANLSEYFYIGDRPKPNQDIKDANGSTVGTLTGSGWLADDDEDGVWELKYDTTSTQYYKEGGPGAAEQYDGARLVGMDQDLHPRTPLMDVSAYDGIIFRYKSNSDGGIVFYDKSYSFSAAGDRYTAWGYKPEGGAGDPDQEYREVVIPFSGAVRSPVISNAGTDDYNLENFDRDQLTYMRFNCREPEDSIGGVQLVGGSHQAWSEIVDFDFFVYE
ncbi:MAG: hypothetical protein LBS57_09185 [Treponema sp.]|jgi:hypothetical protein|nr:hypothetical protein [Treponema sp.]